MKSNDTANTVIPQSADDLLGGGPVREFIMLAGKDSVGKTSALVSLCVYVGMVTPDATVYVVDSENKFKAALRSYGADAPKNIVYYQCRDMNAVTSAVGQILDIAQAGDWIAVESLSRIWENAQNLGYEAVAGVSKIEYLERKLGSVLPTGVERKKSPIPNPDDFWAVVKGAHDGAFFNLLAQLEHINVICTTTIARVKEARQGRAENADRKALRVELGIDANLEGAPRLPYYVETLALMEAERGSVSCRILRDNLSALEDSRITFDVPTKRDWALQFFSQCRG